MVPNITTPPPVNCRQLVENGGPLQGATRQLPSLDRTALLIEVDHCGVCHSDLHLQDGFFDLGDGRRLDVSAQRSLPLTLGHEIAGRVVAAGPDAPQDLLGADVAVYPWIGCGSCRLCERGDEHLCDRPQVIGINVDGGFASHVVVPDARYLLELDGIDTGNAGCLMCSGLTAFSAMRKARPFLAAGPLVIIGAGGVGLAGLRFATALGMDPVFAVDTSPAARDSAVSLGAAEVFDPAASDAIRSIRAATGGAGAVVDFVGAGGTLTLAQRIAAKGGGVMVVGLMGGSFTTAVPMLPFTALTIRGSYVGSLAEARDMLDLVRSGVAMNIPVSERPLAEANDALDALRAGNVVGRVVLRP